MLHVLDILGSWHGCFQVAVRQLTATVRVFIIHVCTNVRTPTSGLVYLRACIGVGIVTEVCHIFFLVGYLPLQLGRLVLARPPRVLVRSTRSWITDAYGVHKYVFQCVCVVGGGTQAVVRELQVNVENYCGPVDYQVVCLLGGYLTFLLLISFLTGI